LSRLPRRAGRRRHPRSHSAEAPVDQPTPLARTKKGSPAEELIGGVASSARQTAGARSPRKLLPRRRSAAARPQSPEPFRAMLAGGRRRISSRVALVAGAGVGVDGPISLFAGKVEAAGIEPAQGFTRRTPAPR
jgi:hypothetical protein